jgi:hypothetical protein
MVPERTHVRTYECHLHFEFMPFRRFQLLGRQELEIEACQYTTYTTNTETKQTERNRENKPEKKLKR